MAGPSSWEDQQAFLAVLDSGSLSAAARQLGVTHATVRSRIETLEQRIGTVLFTRSAHGLVPTEHARSLGDAARTMARASEAFNRAASGEPGLIAGAVRISVSEFVGLEVLPKMLLPLRENYPELEIEIAISDRAADLLDQEADVAVRMHRPRQEALIAKRVGAIPLGLYASEAYIARRGAPEHPSELELFDMIGPDSSVEDLKLAAVMSERLSRSSLAIRTDSHPAQVAAARAGLGIAVAQVTVADADPVLRRVLPNLDIAQVETWIVAHESLRRLPRIGVVFDHLVASFTELISRAASHPKIA